MNNKYEICKTLASGSTGIVKKAKYLNKTYAIKIIDKAKKSQKEVLKEIKIHTMLAHKNIVKLVDFYQDSVSSFMVMQYAEIEVFDLIEPEEGLHPTLIHFYFRQLLSAVNYLHTKGVVHRDIKPENILLDGNGNLLLTDFGYSTLFLYKGKRRRLNTVVGSYRYMAPEVLAQDYDNSVDLWSIGILLLVMFSGTTPWDKPEIEDENFAMYLQMRIHNYSPFSKLSPAILKLFKRLCCCNVKERITVEQLLVDEWSGTKSPIEDAEGLCKDKHLLMNYISPRIVSRVSFSQPERISNKIGIGNIISSQPITNTFEFPSLKRVYLQRSKLFLIKETEKLLDEMVVPYNTNDNVISFSTVDKQRNEMSGEIMVESMHTFSCVSFSRIRGDCIEFKRFFNMMSEKIKTME